jgi:drug/metabolite transporter (DMT)-like permease
MGESVAMNDSQTASARVLPRLQVLVTAILFSTGGAVIKATSLNSWQVSCFRSGIAALVLLALIPAARRGWNLRVLLVGCAYACALTSYVIANKLTTAANTIFLFSAVPLYVLLLGPWLLKEPFHRRDVFVVVAFVSGMTLCFLGTGSPIDTAPMPLQGNMLAALGGFFFALTIMGLRWIGRGGRSGENSSVPAVAAGNMIVFLVCLPLALPVIGAEVSDWLWILYLGSIQVGLAYVFLTKAVRTVPAMEVSVLLLIEPVLNPLWAWWMHRETPSVWTLAGGGLIVLAIVGMIIGTYLAARQASGRLSQSEQ